MERIATTLVLLGAAWVFPWSWLHAQVPVGSEFQVNTYTTDGQPEAKAAMDAQREILWWFG